VGSAVVTSSERGSGDQRAGVQRRGNRVAELYFFVAGQTFGNHGFRLARCRHPSARQQGVPRPRQKVIPVGVGDAEADKRKRAKNRVDIEEKARSLDGFLHSRRFAYLRLNRLRHTHHILTRHGGGQARQNRREDFGVVVDRQDGQVNRVDNRHDAGDEKDAEDDDEAQRERPS